MMEKSPNDCGILIDFIHDHYGMNLKNKSMMLKTRVGQELDRLQVENFADYIDILSRDEEAEQNFLELTATGYTYFLRERDQFRFLERKIFEKLGESDEPFLVWSAGCATGEECYTIAMAACECLERGKLKRPVKIYGSDVSKKELSAGEHGKYKCRQLMKVSHDLRKKYFDEKDGMFCVKEELRKMVCFKQQNLAKDFETERKYDAIFCRNVLVYMDIECRKKLITKFYETLNSGGYLFLGNAETVHVSQNRWAFLGHSIYQKKS